MPEQEKVDITQATPAVESPVIPSEVLTSPDKAFKDHFQIPSPEPVAPVIEKEAVKEVAKEEVKAEDVKPVADAEVDVEKETDPVKLREAFKKLQKKNSEFELENTIAKRELEKLTRVAPVPAKENAKDTVKSPTLEDLENFDFTEEITNLLNENPVEGLKAIVNMAIKRERQRADLIQQKSVQQRTAQQQLQDLGKNIFTEFYGEHKDLDDDNIRPVVGAIADTMIARYKPQEKEIIYNNPQARKLFLAEVADESRKTLVKIKTGNQKDIQPSPASPNRLEGGGVRDDKTQDPILDFNQQAILQMRKAYSG